MTVYRFVAVGRPVRALGCALQLRQPGGGRLALDRAAAGSVAEERDLLAEGRRVVGRSASREPPPGIPASTGSPVTSRTYSRSADGLVRLPAIGLPLRRPGPRCRS